MLKLMFWMRKWKFIFGFEVCVLVCGREVAVGFFGDVAVEVC